MKMNEIISLNPSTGLELGRTASVGKAGIDTAINNAQRALKEWSKINIRQREKYLQRMARIILRDKLEIAHLIATEQGKPLTEALVSEVLPSLAILKNFSRTAHKILAPQRVDHDMLLFSHKKSYYNMVPFGVVAVISPWNFPFSVPMPQIAAAIVAGNTIVFKPAPHAVLIGQKIEKIYREAELPEGVINFVPVQDDDAPYLTEHPGINKIIFTGSTEVGKLVMCSAAKSVKSIVLELGGKDPAIVAADADINRAAKGTVWGALVGSGQVCASIERVYVEKPVAQAFIDACLHEIRKVKVGDPLAEDTDMGPLTMNEQVQKVEEHIADAVAKGAKILYGGKRIGKKGYFFEPTLLTNVNHSMKIMYEETFGPVLPIMTVDTLDEAIRLANESHFGLSAYGWSKSRTTAKKLMSEIDCGTTMINDASSSWGEPNAPWVGFKQSGIGLSRSPYGLLEMVQIKYASYDKGNNRLNLWWFPYTASGRKFFTHAIDFLYQRSLLRKIKALVPMIGNRLFLTTMHWISIIRNIHKAF